jgi:hypothetical protein
LTSKTTKSYTQAIIYPDEQADLNDELAVSVAEPDQLGDLSVVKLFITTKSIYY